MVRWVAAGLVLGCALGCGTDEPAAGLGDAGAGAVDAGTAAVDAGGPSIRPGLALRAQIEQPTPSGHLGEVVPHGDVFYVANSWDAFTAWLREPDGNMLCTLPRPVDFVDGVRCTTLAIHEPSATLYCSSDEAHGVRAYDLADPEVPVLRDPEALVLHELFVRDLHVAGGRLYMARFHRGLWAAPIDEAGRLGEAVPTTVDGNVRFVAGHDPLVVLTADRGLLVLEGTGTELDVRAQILLDGTPQDLSVRGGRAAVALGSVGAAVVDLDADPPRLTHHVRPRAVATSADLDGDALAVTTLTGAYLYDLSADPPRLAGYYPSGEQNEHGRGVMLSGRFADGELVTSDWILVERFAVDLDGHVLLPDPPRGVYVAPGADATIPFRNEGELRLELMLHVGAHHFAASMPPRGTSRVTVPADVLASAIEADERTVGLVAVVSAPDGHVHRSFLRILVREPGDDPPNGRPAPGDPFPDIQYATPEGEIETIPSRPGRTRVVFYTRDCAAMWPVLEDTAFLARTGWLDRRATPLMISESNVVVDGYADRWALHDAAHGHVGYLAPAEVVEHNGSEDVYEQRFQIRELPGAAAHPTDYLLEDGVVEAVEIYYRGAYPLR